MSAGYITIGLGLVADCPTQISQDFPIVQSLAVNSLPAGFFVCLDKGFALADATQLEFTFAITPMTQARPSQILQRITHTGEFPADNASQPFSADEQIANPKITV